MKSVSIERFYCPTFLHELMLFPFLEIFMDLENFTPLSKSIKSTNFWIAGILIFKVESITMGKFPLFTTELLKIDTDFHFNV